ncbi:hypothetical protein GGR52DRAFT_148748 [Hypoxylon sp. FL1284]|nr:hypothetical protein GGR52DRAFT_148748 [Hypoxylon sp. FL1284]
MRLTNYLLFFFVCVSAAESQESIALPDASNAPFSPPVIRSVSFSGNGCPQDGGTKNVSGGWQHFAVTLPDFAVSYGGTKPKSANCQAHMSLEDGEPGWQVALRDVWTKGHLELEPAVKLTQFITVYFSQNAADSVSTTQTVTSPADSKLSKDITIHSSIPRERTVWSPCSGSAGYFGLLNVNFRIAFTSSDTNSYGFYGGSRNSSVNERWGWIWRRC